MPALNKSQLLAVISTANKPKLITIDGLGELYLRKLTVDDQNELGQRPNNDDNIAASLAMIAYSLCDKDGNRLFSNDETDELGVLSAEQLKSLADVISEVNNFSKITEDAKKN